MQKQQDGMLSKRNQKSSPHERPTKPQGDPPGILGVGSVGYSKRSVANVQVALSIYIIKDQQ